jgi:hypothetical protein
VFGYLFQELYECLCVDGSRADHEGLQSYILTDTAYQCLGSYSDTEVIYFDALIWRGPRFCAESIETEDCLIQKHNLPTLLSYFGEQMIHFEE